MLFFSSLAFSVSAYTVDMTTYPLIIQDLKITGENNIAFNLFNPSPQDFELKELKSFEVSFDKVKTVSKFVHHTGSPFTAIGTLNKNKFLPFNVPFDSTGNLKLSCNKPIDVKIYLEDGSLIAHWNGIPPCNIPHKPYCGLFKVDNTIAQFLDEDAELEILWEFLDADPVTGKVLLRKSVGRQEPVIGWFSSDDCPDIVSGKCMTDITDISFTYDHVSITLKDNRHDKIVTLTRTYAPEPVMTYRSSVPDSRDALTRGSQPPHSQQVPSQVTSREAHLQQLPSAPAFKQQEVPIAFVSADANLNPVCATNCFIGGICYDKGARQIYIDNYAYCDDGWKIQKPVGFYCKNNYECETNKCTENKCVLNTQLTSGNPKQDKPNFLTRFLLWVDNLI